MLSILLYALYSFVYLYPKPATNLFIYISVQVSYFFGSNTSKCMIDRRHSTSVLLSSESHFNIHSEP